jgi:four helix bundle protein
MYEDLIVWQKSIQLSKTIYKISLNFPKSELFGLCDQMKRASVSIPSNIAEGYGRRSTNDYKRFLSISLGSVYEIQTQLRVSLELSFVTKEHYDDIIKMTKEIDRMLYALIKKL